MKNLSNVLLVLVQLSGYGRNPITPPFFLPSLIYCSCDSKLYTYFLYMFRYNVIFWVLMSLIFTWSTTKWIKSREKIPLLTWTSLLVCAKGTSTLTQVFQNLSASNSVHLPYREETLICRTTFYNFLWHLVMLYSDTLWWFLIPFSDTLWWFILKLCFKPGISWH